MTDAAVRRTVTLHSSSGKPLLALPLAAAAAAAALAVALFPRLTALTALAALTRRLSLAVESAPAAAEAPIAG